MLVAISGSQGSGKSTILHRLKEDGFSTVERKTSRSILSDWGVTLQEVNTDPELTIKFQDEIISRKALDEKEAAESKDLVFTERTFADLFTYALVSLGKDNRYSSWLDDYYYRCIYFNQQYAMTYYLKAGHFGVEQDGTRGINVHYSRKVDITMLDLTQQMILPAYLNIIDTPDLQQRLSIITAQTTRKLNG